MAVDPLARSRSVNQFLQQRPALIVVQAHDMAGVDADDQGSPAAAVRPDQRVG